MTIIVLGEFDLAYSLNENPANWVEVDRGMLHLDTVEPFLSVVSETPDPLLGQMVRGTLRGMIRFRGQGEEGFRDVAHLLRTMQFRSFPRGQPANPAEFVTDFLGEEFNHALISVVGQWTETSDGPVPLWWRIGFRLEGATDIGERLFRLKPFYEVWPRAKVS